MPSPQRIAILFAVAQELAPTARLLRPIAASPCRVARLTTRHGTLGDRELLLVVGGMGQKRAGAAAEALLREWKPDLLVMAGVAGALSPELQVADVVVADAVTTGLEWLTPTVVPHLATDSHRTGSLLSIAHVLVTAEDKRNAVGTLPRRPTPTQPPTPLAVEMETAAVARAAIRHGVPWAAVRAVSDTAEESLPLDFNRLRTADGDLPTSRVALAAITSPASIPGLIRLGKNTGLAAEALSRYLERWITGM